MDKLRQDQPELAASLEARARLYMDTYAATFPGDRTTGILGVGEAEQEAFQDFANEAPCPALNPNSGLCDIYSARPMTCRVFGPPIRTENEDSEEAEAFAICELCFTTATPEEIASSEMRIPHAEEQRIENLLNPENANDGNQPASETIVAYCLIPASTP
jgi:Fe-S-cluster containining protein